MTNIKINNRLISSVKKSIILALTVTSMTTYAATQELSGDQLLSATNWQGTRAYLDNNSVQTDVSAKNGGFLGLARYDSKDNRYEFFDAKTGKTRGDSGVYFVTQDNAKRIIVSETKKYFAIVDLVKLDQSIFTYERKGKDLDDKEANVFVEHKPYKGKFKIPFSSKKQQLTHKTGTIVSASEKAGADILADTKWQGLAVFDEKGNNVSQFNSNFLGLAHYDSKTNKYEFFKVDGSARGDYGYYDVIQNNKIRVHVSQGFKYSAVLELTELNSDKFTYRRKGKDAEGKEIWVTVEHIPYTGDLSLSFTH